MRHAVATPGECKLRVRVCTTGFSLIELMVSMTIGLMLLATLLVVFANASSARGELERSSRQIENGRYAVELLSDDLRVAGFFGEINVGALAAPAVLPDPCSTVAADWAAAMPVHVQGYDEGFGAPACIPADIKPNTDILVVRRAKTCVAGAAGCEAATAGKPYVQSTLCGNEMPPYIVGAFGTTAFPLKRKDCATPAALREYLVNVYFISANNRAGQNIPTLMRLELTGSALAQVPLVEGIEKMNIEYGIDHDGDGQPDAYTSDPTNYTYAGCTVCTAVNNWSNVVTAQLHVLARSPERSPGHIDTKSYFLGPDAAGNAITVGPTNDGYRRHVYTAMVRIVNPAGRRDRP
ncbi:MAG: PilW family protein [Burkholderiales bacterium]